MRNFITKTALALVLSTGVSYAQFDAEGTDYTNASVDEWVEDQSNQIVDQVNGFACILKAARLDANANRTYEALIDEEECLGEDSSDSDNGNGGGGGNQNNAEQVNFATATIASRKADGDDEPQSAKMFFETNQGERYIAKAEIRSAPSDDLPFGAWSFSYVNGGNEQSPVTSIAGVTYGGFVDIATWEGSQGNEDGDSGFEITTGSLVGESLSNLDFEAGKIRYNNTDDIATFFGVKASGQDQEIVAGRASGQYYYRWSVNPDNAGTGGYERCMDRDNTWSSVHQYKLFYKNDDADNSISAGDLVDLQGGFGFTYGDNDNFGWFDHWGVWFDGEFPFNDDNDTVTVTNDDDENLTIRAIPGRLVKKTFVSETLTIGDTFLVWMPDQNTSEWVEYRAVYDGGTTGDAAVGKFDLFALKGGAADQDDVTLDGSQYALSYMWSPGRMVSVEWDGGTEVNIRNEENVTFDAEFAAGEEFIPEYTNDWTSGDTYDGDTRFFMHGTGNSVNGLDQGILYQSDDTTLDVNDTKKGSYSNWLQVNMILKSDADANAGCEMGDTSGCPATYTWNSGSQWDASYLATDASDNVYDIDEPIHMSYTYNANATTNDDRNSFNTPFDYDTASGFYDPVNVCASDGTACTFAPSDLDGKTYQLVYNGDWLEGLPYTFADDGGYGMYIRLVNLADGTTVSDGTTEYVVKAVALSESIRDADMSECASRDLDFAADAASIEDVKQSFADIGFDPDEVLAFDIDNPNVTAVINSVGDYGGLPTVEWMQDFEGAANPVCTITHGDNSGCEE
jgi:hypothetical protein